MSSNRPEKVADLLKREISLILSQEVKDILMNGTKDIPVDFSWRNKRGSLVERIFPFEGVINNIDRRYVRYPTISNKMVGNFSFVVFNKVVIVCIKILI